MNRFSKMFFGAVTPSVINKKQHKQILDECLTFLDNNGINVGDDLKRIIEYFFSTDNHISFEDIRYFVSQHKLQITDNEIRDTFGLLVEYGFAIERVFADNIVRYEHLHIGEHHDHFYCLKCGKIIEFFSQELEDAQIREAKRNGFHPFNHKMQIHGLCDKCFGATSHKILSLSQLEAGARFRIIEMKERDDCHHGCKMRQRIMNMGILPGNEGTVITNNGGRIVLLVNNFRVALGRGMGQDIKVNLIEKD